MFVTSIGRWRGRAARLLRDRRGATAFIVAIATPLLLTMAGFSTDWALIQVRESQLQSTADAAAGSGRQHLDSFTAGSQPGAVTNSVALADANMRAALTPNDVEQGWWDVNNHSFGGSVDGQTTNPQTGRLNQFNNAVRVTTRESHNLLFGAFLGTPSVNLARQSIGYKCSNTDYPQSVIPDDPNPPTEPAIWLSYPADGSPDGQAFVFDNPDGSVNPVIKFWSPTDKEDVSFVIDLSDGSQLQVDTYCRGTFLVVPGGFDWRNHIANHDKITATIHRGSTNNSFAQYPDDDPKHKLAFHTTEVDFSLPQNQPPKHISNLLPPNVVHVTPFPNATGCCQYWASNGNPTPPRQTILVKDPASRF